MTLQADFRLFGTIKRDGRWYVAYCPPLDIATQGRTVSEAKKNLVEAAQLFLESCIERGTLDLALKELGFAPSKGKPARLPRNAFALTVPVPLGFDRKVECLA